MISFESRPSIREGSFLWRTLRVDPLIMKTFPRMKEKPLKEYQRISTLGVAHSSKIHIGADSRGKLTLRIVFGIFEEFLLQSPRASGSDELSLEYTIPWEESSLKAILRGNCFQELFHSGLRHPRGVNSSLQVYVWGVKIGHPACTLFQRKFLPGLLQRQKYKHSLLVEDTARIPKLNYKKWIVHFFNASAIHSQRLNYSFLFWVSRAKRKNETILWGHFCE